MASTAKSLSTCPTCGDLVYSHTMSAHYIRRPRCLRTSGTQATVKVHREPPLLPPPPHPRITVLDLDDSGETWAERVLSVRDSARLQRAIEHSQWTLYPNLF